MFNRFDFSLYFIHCFLFINLKPKNFLVEFSDSENFFNPCKNKAAFFKLFHLIYVSSFDAEKFNWVWRDLSFTFYMLDDITEWHWIGAN
jgi:hypothetical protein